MTAVSKNVYINKLDETVAKYNKAYHEKMKIKPADFKPGMYVECGVEHSNKDPILKVEDHVRTSKHNNIFTKDYIPN